MPQFCGLNYVMPLKDFHMRLAVLVAALGLFSSGVALGFAERAGAATATFATGVLCLIFVFLPEFKKFKGLGIEAELLDRKLEEADRLLSQLRDLATPLAEMLFSNVARTGRWGSGMPRSQKYELIRRIENELRRCGVSDSQIDQAKQDWHFYNLHDLSSPVIAGIVKKLKEHVSVRDEKLGAIKQPITPERRTEFDGALEFRNQAISERERASALYSLKEKAVVGDKIRQFINDSEVLEPAEKQELFETHKEELKDIDYYAKHKEFRRLEEWLSGEEA